MSKKIIAIVIVLLLIGIGIAWYRYVSHNDEIVVDTTAWKAVLLHVLIVLFQFAECSKQHPMLTNKKWQPNAALKDDALTQVV